MRFWCYNVKCISICKNNQRKGKSGMKNKQTGIFSSPDILISFSIAAAVIIFDALLFMYASVHPAFIAVFSIALLAAGMA